MRCKACDAEMKEITSIAHFHEDVEGPLDDSHIEDLCPRCWEASLFMFEQIDIDTSIDNSDFGYLVDNGIINL